MLHLRVRVLTTVTLVCVAIGISGCSLLNPYVRAKELDASGIGAAGLPASNLPQNQALLSAITAAAAQRTAYYEAVGERAKLRNGLPLVLIPLSAAALYKGLFSDGGESTRKLLMKEGLVGASVFGMASYYTSTTRELVYLAGAKALSCSIYAMTAYHLPDTLGERLSIVRIETLGQQLMRVEGTTQQVRDIRQRTLAADRLHGEMAALIGRAETSIAAARRVLRQSVETQAMLDDAGARLRATVENVVSEVNAQIASSEPDPATIMTIVGSLPATAKQFAPGGTFTAAAVGPAKSIAIGVSEATRPLAALPKEIEDLDAMVASTQFALDVIGQRMKAAPALATCQVQGVQGRIDISPEESVEMKVGETRQFVVRSTAGIPSIEWISSISPQVEMARIVAGETMIVQIAYKAAVEGLSQVTFQAATRDLKKQVTINLLPGAPPPAANDAAKDAAKDGIKNLPSGPKQDEKKTGIAGAANDPGKLPGPRNAFEKGLGTEKVLALQEKLKVPQTGTFDAATRSAIQQWQIDKKKPLRNGVLQSAMFNEILE